MISITIAGVERAANIDLATVQGRSSLALKTDTLEFDFITTDPAERPQPGNEVIWTVDADREFGGVVTEVSERLLSPGAILYEVSCSDYTVWFDHHLVQEEYPEQPADDTVRHIITNYANRSGKTFTANHVLPAFNAPAQAIDYVQPSVAMRQLAESMEYLAYIDPYSDVHFAPIEQEASPLPANALLADTDTASYADLVLSESINQLKNRIFLKGFKTRSTDQAQASFVGDGASTWFPTGYAPWSTEAGDAELTLGGVSQPLLVDTRDGQPGDGKTNAGGYVCFENLGVRFNQPPAAGVQGQLTFNYAINAVTAVDDPNSQAIMAAREGTDGVYEHAVDDPGLSAPTMDTANARATLLLYKYGFPRLQGTFSSLLAGWRAGQSFDLVSAVRMGGLNQRMYVTQVTKQIRRAGDGLDVLRSQVSISDTPFMV